MSKNKMILVIMDGYGISDEVYGNAIKKANKKNLDYIFSNYPNILLDASGKPVGLPDNQMGNSEVGHLNIGAGRIAYQDLERITNDIENKEFFKNPSFLTAINNAKKNNSKLHIFGLLSDGGVHSHIDHIKAIIKMCKENGIEKLYLHAFMDGRDVSPVSGIEYMRDITKYMKELNIGSIGLISGRYYIMDRDKRWDRVKLAYDKLTIKEDSTFDPVSVIKESYDKNITDEFIVPIICDNNATIEDNDSVIFMNFRPDRAREITHAIMDKDFSGFERDKVLNNITYVTMTEYDKEIKNVLIAYESEEIKNTLGEYISSKNLRQLRIAETEKYAHVTFFFNGGVEKENYLEDRILIPSPKVKTYDLKPEMSAYEIKDRVINELKKDKYDLIILNFANSDMVGHTGVFDAAVKAIETLDICVKEIVDTVLDCDYQMLLTADHGNSDYMLNSDGEVVTSHSTNPVPLVYISNDKKEFKISRGKLADIAPTILKLINLDIPKEMTGDVLI